MENTTHFGFKEVATQDKQSMVRGVFDSVANQYDLMNDVLSFGAHRQPPGFKTRYISPMHWSLSVTLRKPKAIDTQSKVLSANGICSPLNCTNCTPER
jgi:hypothetical protein